MTKAKTFAMGGAHVEKYKISSSQAIEAAGVPETVYIPVKQHIGAPAKILVEKGSKVKIGTLLADADGIVSADVHSSVAGEVIKIEENKNPQGYSELMIIIKTAPDEFEPQIDTSDTIVDKIPDNVDEILETIRQSGIVGMGGAGYPTPVKVAVPNEKKADILIVNGIECEPFLTADDRLMVEKAEQIVIGAKIINKLLGIQNAIIAIDENKPEAIEKLNHICKRYVGVNVQPCKTMYPQGAEKQLIYAITKREVPVGKLPLDVGAVVQNAGTVFAIYEAVQKHKPLYERIVTVSGDAIAKTANFRVRIGTPALFLIDQCGGISDQTAQIVFGGPMMGSSVVNPEAPITKLTSGVLLLSRKLIAKPEPYECIRCGKCAEACPLGLQPFDIGKFVSHGMFDEAKNLHVLDCLECGCCSYVCPAKIPLTDFCKLAKYELKKTK